MKQQIKDYLNDLREFWQVYLVLGFIISSLFIGLIIANEIITNL